MFMHNMPMFMHMSVLMHNMPVFMHNVNVHAQHANVHGQHANVHAQYAIMHAQYIIMYAQHTNCMNNQTDLVTKNGESEERTKVGHNFGWVLCSDALVHLQVSTEYWLDAFPSKQKLAVEVQIKQIGKAGAKG